MGGGGALVETSRGIRGRWKNTDMKKWDESGGFDHGMQTGLIVIEI